MRMVRTLYSFHNKSLLCNWTHTHTNTQQERLRKPLVYTHTYAHTHIYTQIRPRLPLLSTSPTRMENKSVVGASSSTGSGHLCQSVRRSVQPASQRKLFGNDSSILLLNFSSNFSVFCVSTTVCVWVFFSFVFVSFFCFCRFSRVLLFLIRHNRAFDGIYGSLHFCGMLLAARMANGSTA